jgi:hypothetical protein
VTFTAHKIIHLFNASCPNRTIIDVDHVNNLVTAGFHESNATHRCVHETRDSRTLQNPQTHTRKDEMSTKTVHGHPRAVHM